MPRSSAMMRTTFFCLACAWATLGKRAQRSARRMRRMAWPRVVGFVWQFIGWSKRFHEDSLFLRAQFCGRFFASLQDEPVRRVRPGGQRHELDQSATVVAPRGVAAVAAQPNREAVERCLLAGMVDGVGAGFLDREGQALARLDG